MRNSVSNEKPNTVKPLSRIVFIDDYGWIVEENEAKYKVILQGSYEWSYLARCWKYLIESIEPKIPLSYLFSNKMLL